MKLSKCKFHKHSIGFLGYIVSNKGIGPDLSKVESVKEWPMPTNIKDIQAFLGLVNYYQKFIKGFSSIATPLTKLTYKDTPFIWNHDYEEAFKELKHRLATTPILTIFDLEHEAILETNTLDYTIGAYLT